MVWSSLQHFPPAWHTCRRLSLWCAVVLLASQQTEGATERHRREVTDLVHAAEQEQQAAAQRAQRRAPPAGRASSVTRRSSLEVGAQHCRSLAGWQTHVRSGLLGYPRLHLGIGQEPPLARSFRESPPPSPPLPALFTAASSWGVLLQMAVPLSRTNLSKADLSKADLGSERDPSGLKRSKSAVRLGEDEETVVVDVTRLHRKEVRGAGPLWTD